MQAPCAPAPSIARFSLPITGCMANATDSRTLPIAAATATPSAAARAARMATVSGRCRMSSSRSARYTVAVFGPGQATFGTATTTASAGAAGSKVSRSPRPSPRAVWFNRQKGTSEPTCSASCVSWGSVRPTCHSRFSPVRAAAASALPPPRPAATGMRFSMCIRAPCRTAPAVCSRRAARCTRLLSSAGTSGFEQVSSNPSPPAASRSVSARANGCSTVSTS